MRLNRTFGTGFALWLALLPPLQGYAWTPACGDGHHRHSGAASTPASPAHPGHCADGTADLHRHDCGTTCCGAAIAPSPAGFIEPQLSAPEISLSVAGFRPTATLDRLDRPPRFIPA